jgi:hypothetical protein
VVRRSFVALAALLVAWGVLGGLLLILSPRTAVYGALLNAYLGISIASLGFTGFLLARELRKR